MKPMQVATNQTTGSSIDSFTLKFRRTVSAGEVLGRREVRHCNNLVETSELWLQVRRWAVLSGTPSQYKQLLDWIFPILARQSLVGRRDCFILNRNIFCLGARPNVLESL